MNKHLLNLLWSAALLLSVDNARAFYNPTTGRWLSRDPIGELGFRASLMDLGEENASESNEDTTPYTYVSNDPANSIDPTGLFSISDFISLVSCSPCGSISVAGSIKVTKVQFKAITFGGCALIPASAVKQKIEGLVPFSKSFPCSGGGTCANLKSFGPLNMTLYPSVPFSFDVSRIGDPTPSASAACHITIYLNAKLALSWNIGCCSK